MTRLENWQIAVDSMCAHGIVATPDSTTRFGNGEVVITSPIVAVDFARKVVVTQSGTRYRLGQPAQWATEQLMGTPLERLVVRGPADIVALRGKS